MSLMTGVSGPTRGSLWWKAARAVALALCGVGLVLAATATADAQAGEPRFALNASGAGVDCDAPSEPTECNVGLGAAFTLSLEVLDPPAAGYIAVQTQLYLDGLPWTPASAEEENVWPDNQLPVRSPQEPVSGTVAVSHGGLTGLTEPFPLSNYQGSVVELRASCSTSPQTFDPAIIAHNPAVAPIGTTLSLQDSSLVPAPTIGTADLDLNQDGSTLEVPVGYILTIKCGGQSAPESDGVPGFDEGDFPDQAPATLTPVGGTRPPDQQTTPGDDDQTPGATDGNGATRTPLPGVNGEDEDDDGGPPWAIIGVVIGAVAVAAAGGAYLWYLRRSRGSGGSPPAAA